MRKFVSKIVQSTQNRKYKTPEKRNMAGNTRISMGDSEKPGHRVLRTYSEKRKAKEQIGMWSKSTAKGGSAL